MGTVAFLCAMPMELRPLTRRLQLRKERVSGLDLRAGTLAGREVVGLVTGMGTDLATAGIERLLSALTPELVLVVGITGAVEDETPIGALVLPEVVVNSETGTEHRPVHLGGGTPSGLMWTTNAITPPEALPDLRARGVVALDMETAAVAAGCERRGVPWSVFRAISDRATEASLSDEVFGLINQDGTPNARAVARYLVSHPRAVPRLAALAKGAKLASETAAGAAIAAVSGLD